MRYPPLNGRDLQDSVVDLAHRLRWAAAHFRNARTKSGAHITPVAYDAKGYPDLTLVRERVIFAEIKGDGDRLRPDQREWLSVLEAAGQEVYVWTPAEWRSGEVERILRLVGGVGS